VAAATHWAFQPVRAVEPPTVKDESWVRTPVDRFVLAKLEEKGLAPAAPATCEQLIRRVTFGLTGLPPTPEEVGAFVTACNDGKPSTVNSQLSAVTDRLLDSSHYGERWARHWLDVVRFAETDGFEHDAVRKHAWRYRDYVIRAFNDDKPYDRFIREQIAGDELWPDDPDAQTATAFSLLGPDMVDSADQTQRRLNTLNDATDTTASAFLGLTFGCAKCHDHKSEPFTQRDYYSMQAFFAPAQFERELAIPTASEKAAHAAAMAAYKEKAGPAQSRIDAIERPHRERIYERKLSKLAPEVQEAHRTPKEKRSGQHEAVVQETAAMVNVSDNEVAKALSPDEKAERDRLLEEVGKIPRPTGLPATMAMRNPDRPPPAVHVLARGDYNNPAEEVPPGYPAAMDRSTGAGAATAAEKARTASARRADLARWMASPDNTLTARVMVNRIWQHHFGRGIVATPGDFGTKGAAPTHPELLDWLAREFVVRGWSIKAMHRLIVLSAAYAQSSVPAADALARDPDNAFVSRQNRMRLEGEAIRDSLLAVSGGLNPKMFGPGVMPPIPESITATSQNWTTTPDGTEHTRRSIYIFARRNLRYPLLEVFDAPDSNLPCAERGRSTTAPQALSLLNSAEVVAAASAMAARLLNESPAGAPRVRHAFRLALGRAPTESETAAALDFLNTAPDGEPAPTEAAAWTEFCRALFNLNAFVYVE
jgi:Protein of unknown function (DUF1553)/Protein of unknown function (DUF1549)